MIGAVDNLLKDLYRKHSLTEDNVSGRAKIRAIRIKICCNGVNLGDYNESTDDPPETVEKVKKIISTIKI